MTPQHIRDAMVEAYLAGATLKEAVAPYGVAPIVCSGELKRRGIPPRARGGNPINKFPQGKRDAIVAAYLAGASSYAVAKQFDCSSVVVCRILREQGVERRGLYIPQATAELILAAYLSGDTTRDAAAQYGHSENVVRRLLRDRGLKPRRQRVVAAYKAQVLAEYEAGGTCEEIGERYGFSLSAISKYLQSQGVEMRCGRFSEQEVDLMVSAYLGGSTSTEVARQFGCSQTAVWRWLKGRGVPRRKTEGEAHSIRVSAAKQGISLADWEGYAQSSWKHFTGQPEYKQWRAAVYSRDNFTCKDCGQRGGTLNAHHIWPKAKFPQLTLELSNGVTLCKDCHQKLKGREEEEARRFLILIGSAVFPLTLHIQ